nr:hypothetical protein [Tanacetum cinerariifolium]
DDHAITAKMLEDKIKRKEFMTMNHNDAVSLCLLAIVECLIREYVDGLICEPLVISSSINLQSRDDPNVELYRLLEEQRRDLEAVKEKGEAYEGMYNQMKKFMESRMELYMLNRQHGRMILESVEHSPLLWPIVEEDGVTRLKKYSELSTAEAIQADCDVTATNIILQGLPSEVYALVSTHNVAKELWKRIQMLMQGTSSTKQERECKLYDEFDKFA